MKRKTIKRRNMRIFTLIFVWVMIVFCIINIISEIFYKDKGEIKVIQVEAKEFSNPMQRKIKPEKQPMSVEEFCEILNQIEGKEIYYVEGKEKTGSNESVKKALNEQNLSKKEKGSYNNYSKEDVTLLANVMYIEVEQYINNDDAEKVFKLVGSVILHRVESKDFPNTLEGVIWDDGEYAKTTLEKIGKKEIPSKVYNWAEELIRDGAVGPENLVFQCERVLGEIYDTYGNQYFCLSK